ncbi:DUF1150 family protein [Marivita sp. GX14005]|uniref:DUF1150 family protein n=1 Tax=Marivita sp. GX14005 TaxID=2942276 RepID=UPI002018F219|nr:DUF1150 family protein [Marivita sp. GX14005]MCL3881262.1 DUF1150 domain-containing protein [Marivita sp. GX14005]
MNTPYDFKDADQSNVVYVRPVDVAELPEDVQDEIGNQKVIYAVHRADGERLALVKDRNLAFMLARQNDLAPVTVH